MEVTTNPTYKHVVNADREYPIMMLDKHIGYDEKQGMGIDGAEFSTEMHALCDNGAKEITVKINSPGGSIIPGMQIYNAVLEVPCKVNTVNIGLAASIAACIFQAGRKRIAYDYSLTMIHNAYDNAGGQSNKVLDRFNQSVCTMLARKTNKTETEIRALMSKETWMNGAECLVMGFCDEVAASSAMNMPRIRPENKTALELWYSINNLLTNNKPKTNPMESILNRLQLPSEATEAQIVAKLDSIENAYKGEVKNLTEQVTELSDKLQSANDALALIEKKANEEKEAALTTEATTFCNDLKNKGVIGNTDEAFTNAVNAYKASPDAFKSIFAGKPVNKSGGANINVENKVLPSGDVVTASEMLKIQAKFYNQTK